MQNSIGTIVKWTMAGWCFFIEILMFYFIGAQLDCQIKIEDLSSELGNLGGSSSLIVALVGVPLGYIFYQIYYFFYWTIPVNISGPAEKEFLEKISCDCMYYPGSKREVRLQEASGAWRKKIQKSRIASFFMLVFGKGKSSTDSEGRDVDTVIQSRESWAIARIIWLRVQSGSSERAPIITRFEYYSSAHDSLGAVQFANIITCVVMMIIWIHSIEEDRLCTLLVTGGVGVLALFLRKHNWWSKISDKLRLGKCYKRLVVAILCCVGIYFLYACYLEDKMIGFLVSAGVFLLCSRKIFKGNKNWVTILLYILVMFAFYVSIRIWPDWESALAARKAVFPIFVIGSGWILQRIIWTNRIYLRLSTLRMMDMFLCAECKDLGACKNRRKQRKKEEDEKKERRKEVEKRKEEIKRAKKRRSKQLEAIISRLTRLFHRLQ